MLLLLSQIKSLPLQTAVPDGFSTQQQRQNRGLIAIGEGVKNKTAACSTILFK